MKIRGCSKAIRVVFCAFLCSELLLRDSVCFRTEARGIYRDDINETITVAVNQTRTSREGNEITLIGFLQSSVSKYGEKKVANSIYELAQKSLYDLMWMLAGDLEPWLILDLYKAYAVSMSDPAVLKVYERFKAGNVNRTIVPEVFALDKKYNEFEWWRRVRTRMLENVDKYIAGNLKVSGTPPNIQFGSDGKPIIGALPIFAQALAPVAQSQPQPARATTTEDPDDPDEEDGEDSDNFEAADLFESLLSR